MSLKYFKQLLVSPFNNGLSEEEEPLVPALLGKLLEEVVPDVVLDAVSVKVHVDGAADGVTVLAGKREGVTGYRDYGQAVGLSFPVREDVCIRSISVRSMRY